MEAWQPAVYLCMEYSSSSHRATPQSTSAAVAAQCKLSALNALARHASTMGPHTRGTTHLQGKGCHLRGWCARMQIKATAKLACDGMSAAWTYHGVFVRFSSHGLLKNNGWPAAG